ncbi:MAG TPA: carbohydrate kinase, partial [Nakamurella multipartita]|nr:carbohydrate kinase [Nakamurella multipartita]
SLPPGGISVTGARNDDGVLRVALQTDDATPAELFGAVLRHSNDEIARLIEAIDAEVPPATSAMLTGGWVDMAAVQRARAQILPPFSVSARTQETAFGAARIAAGLLAPAAADIPIPGAPAPGTATPVPGRPGRRTGPPPAA